MNRRQFVQQAMQAAFIPLLPGIVANHAHANTTASTTLPGQRGGLPGGRRVILVELAGANDGLNTIVPWSNHYYHEYRPTIGLKESSVITLTDDYGFHQKLENLMPLWESSELAVIHGMGYPRPNRSHFKSIALWEAGGDGRQQGKQGWLTHDIEHAYASNEVDAHGIVLGGSMGIFSNAQGNWLSMTAANQFLDRKLPLDLSKHSSAPAQHNPVMELLVERACTLKASLDGISAKMSTHRQSGDQRVRIRGNSRLSQQLTHTVELINAGIDAPVFKVSLSGFDTHENQPQRHQRLLQQLSTALHDLRRELTITDQWKNTVVLTYSEFGRRVVENKSQGTDHGTAAAHLLMGGNVSGGFYGTAPDLEHLDNGDLTYTMDYRAVYNRLLSDWLRLPTDSFRRYSDSRLDTIIS